MPTPTPIPLPTAQGAAVGPVDVALLVFLALFALEGLRRGLLREVFDLLGLVLSVLLALQQYQAVGSRLVEQFGVPRVVADLAGFFGIFLAGILVCSVVTALVERALAIVLYYGPLRPLNLAGGAVAGALKGAVFAALILRTATLLPIGDYARDVVGQSRVAGWLSDASAYALPYLESAFDQISQDALRFLPPVREGEKHDLSIPRGITVWADPESEGVMLRLVNQERALAGLAPLAADNRLRDVARSHSEEMFHLGYFAHESPATGTPFDRLRRAGISFGAAGENLAYAPSVEVAHRGLMNSPEHRRNILAPEFRRVGIGVMRSGLWGRMFTQEFTD